MDLSKKLLAETIRTGILIGTAAGLLAAGLYFNNLYEKNIKPRIDEKNASSLDYNNHYSK